MKFEIWVRNKGTRFLDKVPVHWRLIQMPERRVVMQKKEVVKDLSSQNWYRFSRKFKYYVRGTGHLILAEVELTKEQTYKGEFALEVEVDPLNQFGDNIRNNNIVTKYFRIKTE